MRGLIFIKQIHEQPPLCPRSQPDAMHQGFPQNAAWDICPPCQKAGLTM